MADGSALPRFKRALIDKVNARGGYAGTYESPTNRADVYGPDGAGVGIWFKDEATASLGVTVATGGPHWFDESLELTVIVQALGITTSDDQETVDQRATSALGDVIAILAGDPTAGLAVVNADMQIYAATPTGWVYVGGDLGASLRAASFELALELTSRIQLENP